jgi:hypothetical protein
VKVVDPATIWHSVDWDAGMPVFIDLIPEGTDNGGSEWTGFRIYLDGIFQRLDIQLFQLVRLLHADLAGP